MFTLFNDSGIVVDGAPVTAASLTYPTLTGPVTVALVLASVVGGTRLTLPSGTVLTPGLGELMFTTAVDTYKGNVNIGASCTGKPAEHIAGPPYPGFPPAASGVDAAPTVSSTTTLAVHTVDAETYPDGSVHGIRSDGTTFLIQAAPVAPPAPTPGPCPSVRVSTGGFLFHATDVTDPLATLLIEDCDGIALGYGYPTAGPGHTAELWSCAQPSVLLGYAANQSDCAPPCPCPGTSSTSGANGADGADGAPGAPGAPGQSAYQIAVTNGFVGTEAAWLASLQGAPGAPGATGANGAPGQSAYAAAVAGGFVGTEAAWIASLEGTPGLSAYQVALNNGFVGTEAQWLASLRGGPGVLTLTTYNSYGQLTAATIDGIAYTYTYNAFGQLDTVTFGSTTLTYTYNPDGTINTVS
jgi:hypothetical protein